jgi:hypothetical protein
VFLVPVLVGVTGDDLEEALAGRDHPAMLVMGGLGLLAALSPGCSSRSPRCRGGGDGAPAAVLVLDPPVKPSGSRPTKAS